MKLSMNDDDPDLYKNAPGIAREIHSSEILRQRMDNIGDSFSIDLPEANAETSISNETKPTALSGGLVPPGIDVTPSDNSKTIETGHNPFIQRIQRLCSNDDLSGDEKLHCNYGALGKQTIQSGTHITNPDKSWTLQSKLSGGNELQEFRICCKATLIFYQAGKRMSSCYLISCSGLYKAVFSICVVL